MSFSCKSFLLVLTSLFIFSCNSGHRKLPKTLSLHDLDEWVSPDYSLYSNKIRQQIADLSASEDNDMYADAFTHAYYAEEHDFVWITRHGVDERADTLLSWLDSIGNHGISKQGFRIEEIRKDLETLRKRELTDTDVNQLMGRLEYRLTKAFLRYAAGQRYGYINPRKVFNHLLLNEDSCYRWLYDIPSEVATDSFYTHALKQVDRKSLSTFLQSIQPNDKLYTQLQQEYFRAQSKSDKQRERLASINMERARWRYKRPSGKYVWVNLAGFMLTAVNEQRDSVLSMRICAGNPTHKSPMLMSEIKLLQLNPYWLVPYSIIKREIAPVHAGDSAYFNRNRYRITDKTTGQQMNPLDVTAAMLTSGNYTIRQDNGEGNALGRMIFRFDNRFSVYLHDTNNPAAFQRSFRAVSHGCIRLEKPLELAFFLMDSDDEKVQDKMRIAIDQPPVTQWGMDYLASGAKKMGSYSYNPHIPVYINYFTLYPDVKGVLQTHPDSYGYDEVIETNLNKL